MKITKKEIELEQTLVGARRRIVILTICFIVLVILCAFTSYQLLFIKPLVIYQQTECTNGENTNPLTIYDLPCNSTIKVMAKSLDGLKSYNVECRNNLTVVDVPASQSTQVAFYFYLEENFTDNFSNPSSSKPVYIKTRSLP